VYTTADTFNKSKELLFNFCNENKRIPKSDEKYKSYNIGKLLSHHKKNNRFKTRNV
jgi:hypothetical protein